MKLKTGDEVLVTSGKDKGRRGKVDKVFPPKGRFGWGRIRVAGINVYKKHIKGVGREKGGIVEFFRPLPASRVSLICPNCGKPTRVKARLDKVGEKTRICAKCHRVIEVKQDK